MTKRDCIYIGLLGFISLRFLIDSAVWPAGPPSSLTVNDLIQMIGIVTLFSWWEIEDAARKDLRRSSAARTMTILLAPVGLAIYLFQTRPWKRATIGLIAFVAGLVVAAILAVLLGDWLVAKVSSHFLHSALHDR